MKQITIVGLAALALTSCDGETMDPVGSLCVAPPPGLVSWWPGDTDARDIQDGNAGRFIGFARAGVSGHVGGAFSFNGLDEAVEIPFSTSLINGGLSPSLFSVEVWVMPLSPVTDPIGQEVIFGQPGGAYQLVVQNGSTTAGRLDVLWQFFAQTFQVLRARDAIPIGTVSHVAGTWNGSNTLRLYVNGVPVNELALPFPVIQPTVQVTCPFFIGGFPTTPFVPPQPPQFVGCADFGDQQFFHAVIDEVSYYDSLLTDSEIKAIFDAGSAGKCKP